MSESSSPSSSSAWSVLREPPFARLMAGEVVSMLGTWMQMMAQGWVVAGLTTSAFKLGLLNFASGIPMLLLAMWGGVAADRFDKRRILVASQIIQIGTALAIGWLVGTDAVTVWHILVAGVIVGITAAFEMPAAAALVPELVPKAQLRAAIAVDRSVFHATRLAGPALGGWLIGKYGTASAFYANAGTFVAMIVVLLTLAPRPRGTDEEEAQRQTGMKEGWAYIRADQPTRLMLMLLASATLFISPFFMIMMPLFSRHVLHIPADEHGLLMASSGVGAFVGSLCLLRIPIAQRMTYLRWCSVGIFVAMALLSQTRNLPQASAAIIALTLGTATVFGVANTIVQERAPDAIRGRVSAIAGMSFFGVLPFSGLLMTEFADLVGLRTAMGLSALAFGLTASALVYRHSRTMIDAPPTAAAEAVPSPEP